MNSRWHACSLYSTAVPSHPQPLTPYTVQYLLEYSRQVHMPPRAASAAFCPPPPLAFVHVLCYYHAYPYTIQASGRQPGSPRAIGSRWFVHAVCEPVYEKGEFMTRLHERRALKSFNRCTSRSMHSLNTFATEETTKSKIWLSVRR